MKSLLFGLCLLALAISSIAKAQSYTPPTPDFLRFNEDWSGLKGIDPNKLKPSERIKYIKLSENGDNWVSFGGHLRTRFEDHRNFAFTPTSDADDNFVLYRGLFHADWHIGDNLRIFSEFKHADASGRDLPGGKRPIDQDKAELQQLFIDYKFNIGSESSFALRLGRQEYSFGKSRLISPLPWANALRHWDGVTGILKTPQLDVNFFYSSFNPIDQDGFNDSDSSNKLSGFYAKQKLSKKSGIEYYWLATERDELTFNGTFGDEDRDTFGLRHWGKLSDSLSYEFEGAYQTGDVGGEDISAYMFAGQLVYAFAGANKSKLSFAIDYASGDDDVGGEVNTFNQLFPLGHAYFGFIDAVARQNIIDLSASYWTKTSSRSSLRIAVHNFSRAEDADALYNAGGGVVRVGDANASSDIGNEVDISFNYSLTEKVTSTIGFSQLFAGDFLSDTGTDEDIKFAFVQFLYNF